MSDTEFKDDMVSSKTNILVAWRLRFPCSQVVKDKIIRMQELDVIEPSNNAWTPVLVTNMGGIIQFRVIDRFIS